MNLPPSTISDYVKITNVILFAVCLYLTLCDTKEAVIVGGLMSARPNKLTCFVWKLFFPSS